MLNMHLEVVKEALKGRCGVAQRSHRGHSSLAVMLCDGEVG